MKVCYNISVRILLKLREIALMKRKERTLAIIKPNAVLGNHIGEIIARYEKIGLRVAAMRLERFSIEKAEKFYWEHRNKEFFRPLVNFMVSAPLVVLVLEGEKAIESNRNLMGLTDPSKASPNTLRKIYGSTVTVNAVHGSDSLISAEREINFFFTKEDIFERF